MPTLAEATLTGAERRTLDRLVKMLTGEFGPSLNSIWLFGSRARGEPLHEESDIDLLVLTAHGSLKDGLRVERLVWDAAGQEGTSGAYISAFVHDRNWVEGRRAIESFFIQEVDRDKIVLHGEP